MTKRVFRLIPAVCLLLCLCLCATAEPRYPADGGETTDAAGVLAHTTLEDLRTLDSRLSKADALRLKIVTVDFLDGANVQDYADALFDRWHVSEDTMLLLLAVGEDRYAVTSGKDVNRLISPATQSKLLAACLEEPFLQQEYDAAIASFVPALVNEVNKVYNVSVKTDGLFGRASDSMFSGWADKLQGIQDTGNASEFFLTQEDKSTGFSLVKVVLIVAVLLLTFGTWKKLPPKKPSAHN